MKNQLYGNGNLISKTDFAGAHTIYYGYDNYNRLTSKWYTGYSAGWTYDARGNALAITDTYTSLANTYDDLSRLITTTDNTYTPAKVVGYTYYEDGTRASMTSTDSALVTYTYDKAKRLDLVNLNGATEGDYDYNSLGQREKLTYGNGAFTAYTYTATTRWLSDVANYKAPVPPNPPAPVSSFSYTHDLVGNRRSMQLLGNSGTITYTYNSVYELTGEQRVGNPQNSYNITWAYDGVGNRMSQAKTQGATTTTLYSYNDANQLISDTANTYEYDPNGNLISKTLNSVTSFWTYNWENRQTGYNDPDNNKDTTYIYDALGRRISKTLTVAGTTEKYVYDGDNIIADYNGANALQATYITPFLDQNLMMKRGTDKYYYMHDGLGSVCEMMQNQAVKKSYDYYAFGEVFAETGTQVTNRYKFTGREWDNESSTYYYRARQYNPYFGRFTARDPYRNIWRSVNLYVYVYNNPPNRLDPTGKISHFVDIPFEYSLCNKESTSGIICSVQAVYKICIPASIGGGLGYSKYRRDRRDDRILECPVGTLLCPEITEGGCASTPIRQKLTCFEGKVGYNLNCMKLTGDIEVLDDGSRLCAYEDVIIPTVIATCGMR